MFDNKVLVAVAPVDAADTVNNPEEIAADVIKCAEAGAGMVHLHVRDPHGQLTENLDHLKKTVDLIRASSDIVIEISTGGVSNLTIEQRCAPLFYDKAEAVSLNVGSVNLGEAVYQNPIKDVRYCVQKIVETGKTPEVEVFELGMIYTTLQLAQEFKMKKPLLFSIVLGHIGAAPATIEALTAMRSFIPSDAVWGITHAHRVDNDIIQAAIAMGARTVRVGFEDSHYIDRNHVSQTNAPIVKNMVEMLKLMGKEPMTPSEARKFLNM